MPPKIRGERILAQEAHTEQVHPGHDEEQVCSFVDNSASDGEGFLHDTDVPSKRLNATRLSVT